MFEGTGFSTYNLAMFLLATKLHNISTEVPLMLEGKPKEETTMADKAGYWLMLALNILTGPAYTIAAGFYYADFLVQKSVDKTLLRAKSSMGVLVALCSCVSSVILVKSVSRIRNYFKDKNAIECIKTSKLTKQSIAFVLNTMFTTVWAVSDVFYDVATDKESFNDFQNYAVIAAYICLVIVLLILASIMFEWSTSSPDDLEPPPRWHTILTASTDFELELQRRIWN